MKRLLNIPIFCCPYLFFVQNIFLVFTFEWHGPSLRPDHLQLTTKLGHRKCFGTKWKIEINNSLSLWIIAHHPAPSVCMYIERQKHTIERTLHFFLLYISSSKEIKLITFSFVERNSLYKWMETYDIFLKIHVGKCFH